MMEWILTHMELSVGLAAAGLLVLFVLILFVRGKRRDNPRWPLPSTEEEWEKVGRLGELEATKLIRRSLRSGDKLLTNVELFDGEKRTEVDNLIINAHGVFIIEVKTYSGKLYGDEGDSEWRKEHETAAGNLYDKTVKNPIPQMKRQIHILSNILHKAGFKVWIRGYVLFLYNNSPVKSSFVLESKKDIDRALHSPAKALDKAKIKQISQLLR